MSVNPIHQTEEKNAVDALNFLIGNRSVDSEYIALSAGQQLSVTRFANTKNTKKLQQYLQNLINKLDTDFLAEEHSYSPFLTILLQKFIHLNPNGIVDKLSLSLPKWLKRKELSFEKLNLNSPKNQFHSRKDLVVIHHHPKTGLYTSPEDQVAHQHGKEARRIFLSTQFERLKSFISWLLAKIRIYIFESATYEEHDYIHTDIYANDFAVNPYEQQNASHFFDGHATNLIAIPTSSSPLHVLTDPVEGDLNPIFYPRMTKIANKIDGKNERMLPKVDVVIISHNHRDHVDSATLKKLVSQQPLMIVPEGDITLFRNLGFKKVVELKWWEQTAILEQGKEVLRVTAVPTLHWSGRGLCDAHRSAFNGLVLTSPKLPGAIYFAGDTGLMSDKTTAPIFDTFNIDVAIQPGGPDEKRKDMQSTHQSSADALLMHFKMLRANYLKKTKSGEQIDLERFIQESKKLKTIYNHTAAFKLGNLRLRDTFYSVNRVIAAFKEQEPWPQNNLTAYEYEVYQGIIAINKQMEFANGQCFSSAQIIEIINESVIIPKIGQRVDLSSNYKQEAVYRNLILNKRALVGLDKLTQQLLAKTQNGKQLDVRHFLIAALEEYSSPWHAFFTRSYSDLSTYKAALNKDNVCVGTLLQSMEQKLNPLNRFGHMHSIINYTKWLLEMNLQTSDAHKLNELFICKQVKHDINKEIHSKGSLPFFGVSRKPKQEAFKKLANELERTPMNKTAYRNTFELWQQKTGVNVLNNQRLFKCGKTHSEKVVESNLKTLR